MFLLFFWLTFIEVILLGKPGLTNDGHASFFVELGNLGILSVVEGAALILFEFNATERLDGTNETWDLFKYSRGGNEIEFSDKFFPILRIVASFPINPQ